MTLNKTIRVKGIRCEGCVEKVQTAILKTDSTAKIQVDLEAGMVSVETKQPLETLIAAVQEAGYDAAMP